MSLSGIFDPLVRAWFEENGGGGGSAVDDGFYIEWDGKIEGCPFIDLSFMVGTNNITAIALYKASSLVVPPERFLRGAYTAWVGLASDEYTNIGNHEKDTQSIHDDMLYSEAGWCGVFGGGGIPFIVSGKAGNYSYNGIPVSIPEDGTYFLRLKEGDVAFMKIMEVHKAAAI